MREGRDREPPHSLRSRLASKQKIDKDMKVKVKCETGKGDSGPQPGQPTVSCRQAHLVSTDKAENGLIDRDKSEEKSTKEEQRSAPPLPSQLRTPPRDKIKVSLLGTPKTPLKPSQRIFVETPHSLDLDPARLILGKELTHLFSVLLVDEDGDER